MPSLPEVEVLRRDIDKEIVGRRIKDAEVRPGPGAMHAIRPHSKRKDFIDLVRDTKLENVERRGCRLLLELDSSNWLIVDPGSRGRLLKTGAGDELDSHTHVVMTFTIGGQLRFVDTGKDGAIYVVPSAEADKLRAGGFKLDPLDPENPLAWQHMSQLLEARSAPLKRLLLDEDFIAGLGDVYSDEILFNSGLRYDHLSDQLSSQDVRRFYRALLETLTDAVKAGGASIASAEFTDLSGKPGEYQLEMKVYGRAGEACPRCRNTIVKERYESSETYFCPQCQS